MRDRQRQIEYLGRGAGQHQRDAGQVGFVAHRVAEHPGEMLGQENGLDQNDHRQRLGWRCGRKKPRA